MSSVTVSKSSGEDREKFANESALRPASQYGFIRARTNEREFKQTTATTKAHGSKWVRSVSRLYPFALSEAAGQETLLRDAHRTALIRTVASCVRSTDENLKGRSVAGVQITQRVLTMIRQNSMHIFGKNDHEPKPSKQAN